MTATHHFCLLHGFTQTATSWTRPLDALRAFFPAATFSTPGMPGHGGGGNLPIDLDAGVRAIAEHEPPAIWIGYSMGGRYLLHLATTRPSAIQAMVLVSTTAGIDDERERAARRTSDDELASTIERDGVDAFLERWLALPMFEQLPNDEPERQARRSNTVEGLAASLRIAGTGAQRPLWKELSACRIPTLIITGSNDTKFCELGDRLADTLTLSTRVTIDHAGHAAHLEQPSTFAHAVAEWLTTQDLM